MESHMETHNIDRPWGRLKPPPSTCTHSTYRSRGPPASNTAQRTSASYSSGHTPRHTAYRHGDRIATYVWVCVEMHIFSIFHDVSSPVREDRYLYTIIYTHTHFLPLTMPFMLLSYITSSHATNNSITEKKRVRIMQHIMQNQVRNA